jgi:hypothetical protein
LSVALPSPVDLSSGRYGPPDPRYRPDHYIGFQRALDIVRDGGARLIPSHARRGCRTPLSLLINSVGAAESCGPWPLSAGATLLSLRMGADGMPMADVHLLAPDLSLAVSAHNDAVAIRDVNGVEWQTANGLTRLDGPLESRALTAVLVTGICAPAPRRDRTAGGS